MNANPIPVLMRPCFQSFPRHRMSGLLLAMLLSQAAAPHAAPAQPAAPVTTSASTAPAPSNVVREIPQSIFVVSSPTQVVKDPFFPNTTRLAAVAATHPKGTNAVGTVVVDLVLKAIFGTPARPLATVNNATFGVGEEQDVVTPAGRVRVRCIEISLNDESVVVEAAGSQRELRFPRRK